MKRLSILSLTLVIALGAFALAGCSDSKTTIGQQSDGATTFVLKNETGQALKSVALKSSDDSDYGEALKQKSDLAQDAEANLYVTLPEQAATEGGEEGAEDIALNTMTDVKVELADGTTYEMHELNLDDVKDASLKLDGEFAYLAYTSVASGEAVDTLETEKAYKQKLEEEAKAKAEAEAKAKEEAEKKTAEEAAAKEAAAKKSSSSSNSSSSSSSSSSSKSSSSKSSSSSSSKKSSSSSSSSKKSSSSSSSSGSSSSSSSGSSSSSSGGEDACVDDVLLRE